MKFSEPKVLGFPGLPPWLDLPKVKRLAAECECSEKDARTMLFNQSRGKKADQLSLPLEEEEEHDETGTERSGVEPPRATIRPIAYRSALPEAQNPLNPLEIDDGW